MNFILAQIVAVGITFLASNSAFAAKSTTTYAQISKLLTENGCSEQSIAKQTVRLNSLSAVKKDILVYCESECGANQCSYSIYSYQNKDYQYLGSFTGNYKISKNKSKNFYDLIVISRTALGNSEKKILRFKGDEYQ